MRMRKYSHCFAICFLVSIAFCTAREEVWTEVKTPNFIVISDASPKRARNVVKSFEQFRLLLRTVLTRLKTDPGAPLIIFGMKDGKGLKALIPLERLEKKAAEPSGIFMNGQERNFVALRLDIPEEQAYHTIYHEYVHMILRLNFPKIPLWLNEGLAELFANSQVSDGESTLGNPSREAIQTLRTYSMMPIQTLLSVKHDSPYYTQADKARIFYAQSWVLTHYLFLGEKGAHAKQIAEFMDIQNGRSEEEAIALLGDLKALQKSVERYMNLGVFYHLPVKFRIQEEGYESRSLAQPESMALRGQFLIGADRPADAKALLEAALQIDSSNAEANEGMGLLYMKLGDQKKAGEYFSTAAKLDSKSFLTQYFAAKSEYENRNDHAVIEGYLRKSLEINPRFVPAYNLLSIVLATQEKTRKEALSLAAKAAGLEPAEIRHCFNVCEILIAMRNYGDATDWARRALALGSNEGERSAAKSMLDRIKDHQEFERRKETEATNYQRKAQLSRQPQVAEQPRPGAGETKKRIPIPPNKGLPRKVMGVVKSVKCDDPATIELLLDSKGKQQKLFAENYYNLQYEAIGGPGKSGFEPCQELQGKWVEIEFLGIADAEFSGIMRKVGIIK